MERSRTSQLMASEASVANSTAFALSTGKAPGNPRHTGQTLVLGAEPNWLAQPQKALVAVSSCTWTSSPITGSYLARTWGESAAAGILSLILTRQDFPRGSFFPVFRKVTDSIPDFLVSNMPGPSI